MLTPSNHPPPSKFSLTPSSQRSILLTSETEMGKSVFGSTSYFPFTIPVTSPFNIQSFTISDPSISSKTFKVPFSGTFIIPSLSTIYAKTSTIINITIASHGPSYSPPKIAIKAPIPQPGTLAPFIKSHELSSLENVGTKAGFTLWAGTLGLGVLATGRVAIEALNSGFHVVDMIFLK